MKKYIIIPTLEPDPCFCARIEELLEQMAAQVVVVDDGSGEDYREIFKRIDEMDECIVLHHEENKGKGRALKTGFSYVRRCVAAEKETAGGNEELMKPAAGILCLDSDGQHSAENGAEMLELAENCPGTLILGGRDFSGREVPWKSRLGNRVSSAVFRLISGRYLSDTQTGLRAFDDSLLDLMLEDLVQCTDDGSAVEPCLATDWTISDDGLTWTNVSDLKFWDCAPAQTYGVRSIPSNLLIGPDGTIVARNVTGKALIEKLNEVYAADAETK